MLKLKLFRLIKIAQMLQYFIKTDFFGYTHRKRLMVLLTNLATIAVFLIVGYFIGKAAGKPNLGMLVSLLVSFPVSQYLIFRLLFKNPKTN